MVHFINFKSCEICQFMFYPLWVCVIHFDLYIFSAIICSFCQQCTCLRLPSHEGLTHHGYMPHHQDNLEHFELFKFLVFIIRNAPVLGCPLMRVLPIIGAFNIIGKIHNILDFSKNCINFLCGQHVPVLGCPLMRVLPVMGTCHIIRIIQNTLNFLNSLLLLSEMHLSQVALS